MYHDEPYRQNQDGIFLPPRLVAHREETFDSAWFEIMREMQLRHFWYLGRHRFILRFLARSLRLLRTDNGQGEAEAVDLGGGCGGWIRYLEANRQHWFSELALADSSLDALTLAKDFIGPDVKRYQIDLHQLFWSRRWDLAFLLDVLEHIPEDCQVLQQIWDSLRPGGLLIVATPALNCFWSYIDDLNSHVRRYSRTDFARLANKSGFEHCSSSYFMFFLSPLLLLSRWKSPDLTNVSKEQARAIMNRTHRIPCWLINQTLRFIFSLETPVGVSGSFPWGASVVGVFRRPR